jgi:peptidoglycan/LPS O-acetylase OafA/YrhL
MLSGDRAVRVFFIISGFYMAMILTEKYGFSPTGLKKFFLNRVLRLYPTYYAALVGSVGWYYFCVWSAHGHAEPRPIYLVGDTLLPWQRILLWAPNFTLLGLDIPFWFNYSPIHGLSLFPGGSPPKDLHAEYWLGWTPWVGQAWSVSVELVFYILAPFSVQGRNWRPLILGLISLAIWNYIELYLHFWAYFFWPAEFHFFIMGILAFKAYTVFRSKIDLFFIQLSPYLFLPAALTWIVFLPLIGIIPPVWLLTSTSMVFIPALFHITKDNVFDRFAGNLSYPIYCIHMLVWELVRTAIGRFGWSWELFPVLAVFGSIIGGTIVYLLVDHFIEHIRVRVASSSGKLRLTS